MIPKTATGHKLLGEAVDAWPQFDTPHDQVSGADLVEWFAEWRERAKQCLAVGEAAFALPVRSDRLKAASSCRPTSAATARASAFLFVRFDRETFEEIRAMAVGKRVSFAEALRQVIEWGLDTVRDCERK